MVAHSLWERGAVGSNPATPTDINYSAATRSTPVKSTVETLSPTRVKLAIEVPFDELKPSLQKAYREIGAQVQVPGFRRGKIPAAVIDQRVGRGAVLNEAVQEAIPQQILAAVREHDVKTLGRPEVEITEFADNEPLKFTAEVDVRPEITIPDLSTISVTVPETMLSRLLSSIMPMLSTSFVNRLMTSPLFSVS